MDEIKNITDETNNIIANYTTSIDIITIDATTTTKNMTTKNEENNLLEEIEANIDMETIAKNHKRKVGGITSRIWHIANELYIKGYTKSFQKQIRSSEINIITELYELKKSLNEINDKIDKMISKIEKKTQPICLLD